MDLLARHAAAVQDACSTAQHAAVTEGSHVMKQQHQEWQLHGLWKAMEAFFSYVYLQVSNFAVVELNTVQVLQQNSG